MFVYVAIILFICADIVIIMDSDGSESGAVHSGFDLQSQIKLLQEQLAQFPLSSSTRPVSQLLYVPVKGKLDHSVVRRVILVSRNL